MYTVVAAGGAAGVSGGTAGEAAVVGYSTAGGAVKVNCGAAGVAVTVKSESTASMAAVCPGGSTVPATVMIVVEHRLVYQLIVGISARS